MHVDVHWVSWPEPHFWPTRVYFPLGDPNDPEQCQGMREFAVKVVEERAWSDPDLGVAGTLFTVDVDGGDKTVRTVVWFDDEKWMVEEKVKKNSEGK